MSQYRTGYANVSYGTTTVVGSNTEWLLNVSSGNTFKVEGENAIYNINSVISDTCIKLEIPYGNVTNDGLLYQIHRDFTSRNKIPEVNDGDRDWPFYVTRGIRVIDNINYLVTISQILQTSIPEISTAPDGFYSGITASIMSNGATSAGSVTMINGTLCGNTTTTVLPAARMALSSEASTTAFTSLLQGVFKKANTFNYPATKIGFPLYVGPSGTLTTTALGTGLYQQIAGVVMATQTVYFNPGMGIVKT